MSLPSGNPAIPKLLKLSEFPLLTCRWSAEDSGLKFLCILTDDESGEIWSDFVADGTHLDRWESGEKGRWQGDIFSPFFPSLAKRSDGEIRLKADYPPPGSALPHSHVFLPACPCAVELIHSLTANQQFGGGQMDYGLGRFGDERLKKGAHFYIAVWWR